MFATIMLTDENRCLKSFQITFDRYETAFAIMTQTNRFANNIDPRALYTKLIMSDRFDNEKPYTLTTDLWHKVHNRPPIEMFDYYSYEERKKHGLI